MKFDFKGLLDKLKILAKPTPSGKEDGIFLYRDWRNFVIAFGFVVVIAIGVDLYLFYETSYGSAGSDSSGLNQPGDTLSRAKLQSVIDIFSTKQTKFSQRKAAKPDVPNL